MEQTKIKELIGLILTDLKEFESQYANLHHSERDKINPYLNKLDDKDYMEQVKETIRKWFYYVPPHSPPPFDRNN